MGDLLELLSLEEVEGLSTSFLQSQLEKIQADNYRLSSLLIEALSILEELSSVENYEDLDELVSRTRKLLEDESFNLEVY